MPGQRSLSLTVLVLFPVAVFAFEKGPAYRELGSAAAAKNEVGAGTGEAASQAAGRSFDEPIDPDVFAPPSRSDAPPPTLGPAPSGDFVVGRAHRYGEPGNPLTKEDKPKERGSKFAMKIVGAVVGGLLCGLLGFLLGGPIGAAVGFAAGALGGWMVTH